MSDGDGGAGGALLLFLVALYFLPTLVAAARGHHNKGAIIVVNVFLGWSLIGWVVALAMAAGAVRKDSVATALRATPAATPPPEPVMCVKCGQPVSRLAYRCVNCRTMTSESLAAERERLAQPTEHPCPYCESPISLSAKKCRYCGEWVVPESERTSA